MRGTAVLTVILCLSGCTVGYGGGRDGNSGSVAAGFGDVYSDSRQDIDVGIDLKERPEVVPGMTRAGVVFVVEVGNRSTEPLRLTRVQLQTVAEEATLAPLTGGKFNKVIKPGSKEQIELGAFFDIEGDSLMALEGPMLIRATLFLRDDSGGEHQAYFTRRLGSIGAGVTMRPQTL